MHLTPAIDPPAGETTCTEAPPVPRLLSEQLSQQFVEPQTDGRLIPALRDAARQTPAEILARSGVAYYRAEHPLYRLDHPLTSPLHVENLDFANALADLAVTGRMAYTSFQAAPPGEAALAIAIGVKLGPSVPALELADVARRALDRAYAVAWALRGPALQRDALRSALTWIAVSGEDDKPHRPVNVAAPAVPGPSGALVALEQFEIPVTAKPGLTVSTRFFIASAVPDPAPPAIPVASRALPPVPTPNIPPGHRVILFLHGHSSGAEEALLLIPHILKAGLDVGTKYSVVSIDLPNNGYSQTFNQILVADPEETTYPAGIGDHTTPIHTPILDYVEDFVVAFVDALHLVTPVTDRFAGVIGGSLGGNLGLRLGRRPLATNPWLEAGIVSWSPASVWPPMVENELLRQGPDGSKAASKELEKIGPTPDDDSRHRHFAYVYEQDVAPVLMPHEQPYLWYRDEWAPCKDFHILASRFARQEVYNADFRQWHWRLVCEQLIYSHVDGVDHHDPNSQQRFELNTVRQLLVAGREDDAPSAHIYRNSQKLAGWMVNTPGRSLFLNDTGHSIHVERPIFLAGEIVKFLEPFSSLRMQITCVRREHEHSGAIRTLGGTASPGAFPFHLTEAECVRSIQDGNEFFVVGADGRHAEVVVKNGPSSTFLITTRDDSRADNLLSLPSC
jgi:pimeloyl-ACP methyl ester carboxylesterase